MIRRCIVLLYFICHSISVNAGITIDDVASVTGSPEQLSGDFQQKKYIKAFDTSVASSGKFHYSRGQYIHWDTLLPIENHLVMTPDKILSKQNDDELISLDAKKNPTVKVLNKVFFAVLAAEWQTLNQYFSHDINGSKQHWQVVMKPKKDVLPEAIVKVELSGEKSLQRLALYESNGDVTYITFSNIR